MIQWGGIIGALSSSAPFADFLFRMTGLASSTEVYCSMGEASVHGGENW